MKSLRREYPLSTLLKLMGMSRSTYYYHEANPPSDRQATERPVIVEICEKSQFRYGYRRVAVALRKAAGIRIADKTVLKVMRGEGLLCRTRRRRKYRLFVASKMLTKRHVAFEHFGRHVLHCFFALPSIKAASMRWLAPLNSTSLPWWTILSIMADASLSSPRTVPHFENSMFVVNIMLRLS